MRDDIPPLAAVRERTQKQRDAWWTVLLVDPLATPLVRWTAIWTRATPNQITWLALLLGLGAAACFAQGDWGWLLAGAALFHVSFVLDCMDGKLARLTGTGSLFGAWLDYVFDRIRVLVCAIALMGGQYARSGEVVYLWLALAVVFLDMLRYVDALQSFKVNHDMRRQLTDRAERAREAGDTVELAFMEDLLQKNPEADVEQDRGRDGGRGDDRAAAEPVVDLHREFRGRFPWYTRFRSLLQRRRIRPHLMSGIEFQMAVFIVAPVLNAVVPVTIAAGALLLLFEFAIVYKLQLSTREFERTLARLDGRAGGPPEPAEAR